MNIANCAVLYFKFKETFPTQNQINFNLLTVDYNNKKNNQNTICFSIYLMKFLKIVNKPVCPRLNFLSILRISLMLFKF